MTVRVEKIHRPVIYFVILIGTFTAGCTMPLVWEEPAQEPTPFVPSLTPAIASTLPETQIIPTLDQTPQPPTETATIAPPTHTPTATRLPFILQPGAPAAGLNFAHPELGCSWFGIAGQVLDFRRKPIEGMVIEVNGTLGDEIIQGVSITGSAPLYGPGGYELTLGDQPLDSIDGVRIQVRDVSGTAVSEIFFLETFSDCEKNLILVTFIESPDFGNKWFMPIIFN